MGWKTREAANNYNRQWYLKNKARRVNLTYQSINRKKLKLQQYKLDRGCVDCGYKEHAEALDFDHLSDKTMNVSNVIHANMSWERIMKEVSKCEVVCANCHRVRTANRRKVIRPYSTMD
jgi:hypothetical protein